MYISIACPYYFPNFFFTYSATIELYTLSLHDALPIWTPPPRGRSTLLATPSACPASPRRRARGDGAPSRSEEHTSELQSHSDLVCRLLLEKKKLNIEAGVINDGHEEYPLADRTEKVPD